MQIYGAIKAKKKRAYVTKRWAALAFVVKHLPASLFERL
jgi:hypothetical protein